MTKPKLINKIVITVSGTATSGKSTIMQYIGSILAMHGFKVDISSKDFDVNLLPSDRLKKLSTLLDKGTTIKIETKQSKNEISQND